MGPRLRQEERPEDLPRAGRRPADRKQPVHQFDHRVARVGMRTNLAQHLQRIGLDPLQRLQELQHRPGSLVVRRPVQLRVQQGPATQVSITPSINVLSRFMIRVKLFIKSVSF